MITEKDFMLCESIREEELDNPNMANNWIAEIKEDGERIIAVVIDKDAILINRRGKICNFHFQEIVDDLKQMDNCIIDGEIISEDGNFTKLQRRALTKDMTKLKQLQTEIPLKYMVFDVLRVGDNLLTSKPLKERKEELKKLFENKQFKYTEILEWGDIKTIFAKAKAGDNEGIVVKNLNGVYEHRRSREWLKCKFFLEKDIVFTKYEVNPNGIRVENSEGIACQVAGQQSQEVKEILDKEGKVELTIQCLEETEDKKLRFPSYKTVVYSK